MAVSTKEVGFHINVPGVSARGTGNETRVYVAALCSEILMPII